MANILPPAETTFFDLNGAPLALGKVYFYVPNTLTPKDTYQNAAGSVLNTNPVDLDAAGRAVIWGNGPYRQILKDADGNEIWDKITTVSQVENGGINFGTAGGTVDAITVTLDLGVDPYQVGIPVSFQALGNNTGPVTINVDGYGPIALKKYVTEAMEADDIKADEIVVAIYDGTNYQYQNPIEAAEFNGGTITGDLTLLGSVLNTSARTDIASASSVDLQAVDSNYLRLTGTTTVNIITLDDGVSRTLVLGGAITFTNSGSLILPGSSDYVGAAGDTVTFFGESGGVVRMTAFQRASITGNSGPTVAAFGNMNTGGGTTTITIPATSMKLARINIAEWTAGNDFFSYVRFNSDSGSNYTYGGYNAVNNASLAGIGSGSATAFPLLDISTAWESSVADNSLSAEIVIPAPRGALNKHATAQGVGVTATNLRTVSVAAQWADTSAITTVQILAMSGGGAGPSGSPVSSTGGYWYLTVEAGT